jgi:hypothetical protein
MLVGPEHSEASILLLHSLQEDFKIFDLSRGHVVYITSSEGRNVPAVSPLP